MKRCLACSELHDSPTCECPACGFAPVIIGGFEHFAPHLAAEGTGFKSSYFSRLAQMEEQSFWFRARNRLIAWMLRKYHRNFASLLEIGCGTGYVLSALAASFPNARISGSEIYSAGLEHAAVRLPSARLMQMDARDIPFADEFDVIGIFDVLEHIKEDADVVAQAHRALKEGGTMLLTVPQHAWLWSPADDHACHERRYAARDLHELIERTGFRVIRSTSFISLLLPAMAMSRLLKRMNAGSREQTAELNVPPVLDFTFSCVTGVELAAIKCGLNFPVGGSRLIVARKVSTDRRNTVLP